jgi:ribosomal protein S18 acetylase RimI-like enzyme
MSDITIRHGCVDDIPGIQSIAEKSWRNVYGPILTTEQIEYMLHRIYSTAALTELFDHGSQLFRILLENVEAKGFLAYGPREQDPSVYKIHKLYVLPETQGKGFGRMLIDDVKKRVLAERIFVLDLNVNRFNPAKSFYERMGFYVLREEDVPIGPYWMNDFVMRLLLHK